MAAGSLLGSVGDNLADDVKILLDQFLNVI